jgi:hypothetical protein
MKRPGSLSIMVIVILLACFIPATYSGAQGLADSPTPTVPVPFITLSPNSGFSSVTIQGTGFPANYSGEIPVEITWDGKAISSNNIVPSPLYTSIVYTDITAYGRFTAIFTVPAGASTGNHKVRAEQDNGDGGLYFAEANFQVIDLTGPAGASGVAGVTGAKGAKGEKGEQGDQGEKGLPGSRGASGISGQMGPMGPMGPQGFAGARGPSGAQGATGPQGPAGMPGQPGTPGPTGPAGPAGDDGKGGGTGLTTLSIVALVVGAGTLGLFVLAKMKKWIFG